MKRFLLTLLGPAALATAAIAQPVMPPATFAESQAAEGQPLFAAKCALCHGAALEGGDHGPKLKGADFWKNWRDLPARKLYSRIISTMPYDDPGSLTEAQTLAITALIARSNGAPDGPIHSAASDLDGVALKPN